MCHKYSFPGCLLQATEHYAYGLSFEKNWTSISKFVTSVLTMVMVHFYHMTQFPFCWVDFHWKKDHDVPYFITDTLEVFFL